MSLDTEVNELRSRIERLEAKVFLRGEPAFDSELGTGAPAVEDLRILAESQLALSKTVVLVWTVPDNPLIDTFEVWAEDTSTPGMNKVLEVREPPATVLLTPEATTAFILRVRTRMKDLTGTVLQTSPAVSTTVTVTP